MPSPPVILMVHKMHESGIRLLREAGEVRFATGSDPATLQREVVGVDAMIIRTGGDIDADLLDRGKDLKVVGRHGVGYDQIDIDAATARGIQVVYTPGANTQSVGEHVFALMIGLSKHFPRMMSELARGNYHARTSLTGRELAGKTLGIIGFGRIGRRVGEIAHLGFGMKVIYHDIVPAPEDVELRAGARRVGIPRTARGLRLHHLPRPPRFEHPRHDRSVVTLAHEISRDPHQHQPGSRGRRGRRGRPRWTPAACGATAATSSPRSRRPRTTP